MELTKKLKLDLASPLWVVTAPGNIDTILPGVGIHTKAAKKGPVRQLMLFVRDIAALHEQLPKVGPYIGHNTLFWICYPKQTGSISSDLVRMTGSGWDIMASLGYRGQTSVSINDDWTGIRFTNAPRKKPSQAELPQEERKVEGIDFVNRTVQLPADALAVLSQHKGLVEAFDAMAFTHKKEYMMAIADAKKPETRTRRIEKTAEMMLQIMQEKELKQKAKARK